MNLYLVYRMDKVDYDNYDSFVCAAESEGDALTMVPGYQPAERNYWDDVPQYPTWARNINDVQVKLLGEAAEGITGIQCESFNAG